MTGKLIPTAMLALFLTACGDSSLTTYPEAAFAPCGLDQGAWAGERRTTRYVEESFHDLSRHFDPFIEAVERTAREAADRPRADWPALFAPLHVESVANIGRVGRLLPRMERALDLTPMIEQMQEKQIWWPMGGHHTEFVGVAIAEEIVDHQDSSVHMAQFLTRLNETENLLLELKAGGGGRDTPVRLRSNARALRDDWDAAATGFRRVIFDRPNMPVGESLGERLQTRVSRICESYSTCSGGEDVCGTGGDSGDDGSDEPAEPSPAP